MDTPLVVSGAVVVVSAAVVVLSVVVVSAASGWFNNIHFDYDNNSALKTLHYIKIF